jgi:hypothetical protein
MIGSIGGFNPASYAAATALNRSKTVSSSDSSSSSGQSVGGGAKDDFLKYMKMSPGERMEENWLRAHGLSREKLAALPPKEREDIMKQMKQDIEKKLKDQAEQKTAKVDITV